MGKMRHLLPNCVVCGKVQTQTPVADTNFDLLALGMRYGEVPWLFPNICQNCTSTIAEVYVRDLVGMGAAPVSILSLLYFEITPKDSSPRQRLPISFTKRRKIMERDKYRCRYCGDYVELEIDHLIPVSKGGTNEEENLVTACRLCNRVKGTNILQESQMNLLPCPNGGRVS